MALPDSVEEMTFAQRVEWTTQMAFDGLIKDGTQGLRSALWAALSTMAYVDARAGSKWALKESD